MVFPKEDGGSGHQIVVKSRGRSRQLCLNAKEVIRNVSPRVAAGKRASGSGKFEKTMALVGLASEAAAK